MRKGTSILLLPAVTLILVVLVLALPVNGAAVSTQGRYPGYEQGGANMSATTVQDTIRVLMPDGTVRTMDMDEYLKGVVPSEIGASAPYDALCAQAVAARCYAATSYRHPEQGANVCTTTHCQVWSEARDERVDIAVESTHKVAALYKGEIISAYYFGHCDGHTRNSESVWGGYLPYCRSVSCPCGNTSLFGHGVGMCQEGAKTLASAGWDYCDILSHYYEDVEVQSTQPEPAGWYFAEGTTRPGYKTYLCLSNPNEEDAEISITYLVNGEENVIVPDIVEANSRKTIDPADDIGYGRDFSCTVTSENGVFVVAERPVYFNKSGITGGHDAMGVNAPSAGWYFAEGTTRPGYTTYLCVGNPTETEAQLRIRYFIEGDVSIEVLHTVGPMTRETVNTADDIGEGKDFSCEISSINGTPVVAERPVYFDTGEYSGGHDAPGASQSKMSWYFAEGTTRKGYDTYICLGNPNEQNTEVKVQYYIDGEERQEKYYTVGPLGRLTLKAARELGRGKDFSCRISTINSMPFIAERPMYYSSADYNGGHDTLGAPYPKAFWCFAEGTVRPGYSTFVCLGNPTPKDADVLIYYLRGDGTIQSQRFDVAAYSRCTVNVNDFINSGEDEALDVGIEVTVVNRVSIFVERPMYFDTLKYNGGHDTIGH